METVLFVLSRIGDGLLAVGLSLLSNETTVELFVLLVVMPLVVRFFKAKGVEIDERRAAGLQSAIPRAILEGLAAAGVTPKMLTGEEPVPAASLNTVLDGAVGYLREKRGGTLDHFKIKDDDAGIIDLLVPHLPFPFNLMVRAGEVIGNAIETK